MQQNGTNSGSDTDHPRQEDYPEELKAKAREFFTKGAEVAYALQYDYAIELHLDGLSFWPNNVEEGHKPLREIALRRQASGGKKSGFSDGSKYKKASGKNPKDAIFKAEYLLSKDPSNQGHMTDMIKAAAECGYRETTMWMAEILFYSNLHQDKPSLNTYVFLRDIYCKIEAFELALRACQLAQQLKPKDIAMQDAVRDLSAQATLQKGRYDNGSDFRESIKDRESQEKLQAQKQVVRSANVLAEAIAEARQEYEAEPKVQGKINKLVTALCDTEEDENENEAISILEKAHADLKQFYNKQRSGEIRIKQLTRRVSKLKSRFRQDTDNRELGQKLAEAGQKLLQTELVHYKLCVENYPTDLRMKYEYAKRLMQAKKYDEAIPLFQASRSNPRHRIESLNGIGRCFFYKQWYPDAVETFEQALELVENKENVIAKELMYNLARAHEADGNIEEALKYYRKVAQIDFNYRTPEAGLTSYGRSSGEMTNRRFSG